MATKKKKKRVYVDLEANEPTTAAGGALRTKRPQVEALIAFDRDEHLWVGQRKGDREWYRSDDPGRIARRIRKDAARARGLRSPDIDLVTHWGLPKEAMDDVNLSDASKDQAEQLAEQIRELDLERARLARQLTQVKDEGKKARQRLAPPLMKLGMAQRQIAEALGVDHVTLHRELQELDIDQE